MRFLVPAAHQPRCVITSFPTVNPDLCWLPVHQATSSGTCTDLTGHTCGSSNLVRLKTILNHFNWQHQCIIVCLKVRVLENVSNIQYMHKPIPLHALLVAAILRRCCDVKHLQQALVDQRRVRYHVSGGAADE